LLTSLVFATCLSLALASPAFAVDQSGVFSTSCISQIDIEAPQTTVDALRAKPREEYQPASLSFDACGLGTDIHGPVPVTLRLKGNGSFRTIDGKAAFRIKFAKANRLDKLKSFTLNNMVQDFSSIREVLGYETFGRLGIVAARAGYAKVAFNGQDFGLYANVESLDDRFVEQNFDSTSHLFESPDWGEGNITLSSRDILPGSVANFEIEEGDDDNRDDLASFAAIAEIDDDAAWWDAFKEHTDATAILRLWAAYHYLGISDSYAANTNNYYLHSDEEDAFTMIPSGIDGLLKGVASFPNDGGTQLPLEPRTSASELITRCFGQPSCRNVYLQQLELIARSVLENLDLVGRAHELTALVSGAAVSGRSEQTGRSQCLSAATVVDALRIRAHEILDVKQHQWNWSPISSTQSSTAIDCARFVTPEPPAAPPTATAQARPTIRTTGVIRLRSGRDGLPRYRLHLRTEAPGGGRWTLRVLGSRGVIATLPLGKSETRISFRTRRGFIWTNAVDDLGRGTRWIRVRLPR
jgi:hypothetical protein